MAGFWNVGGYVFYASGVTEDFSFDVKWNATERLRFNLEAQRVKSDLNRDSVIGQGRADAVLA